MKVQRGFKGKMDGQIDLFELEAAERWRQHHEEARREWEKAPRYKPCRSDCYYWDYSIWIDKVHLCDTMPEGVHVWQNTFTVDGQGEFWVHNLPHEIEGRRIYACPYCGCDLSHGQGDRFLEKRDEFV